MHLQLQKVGLCTRKHALFVKLWSLIFYLDNVSFAGLQKRPIYNVAHMVNGNNELNKDWVKYGNALESDLQFNADGSPRRFYHGFPCDCGRNCFHKGDTVEHLQIVRSKAQDMSQNFALFWIDLKLGAVETQNLFSSGQQIAKVIIKNLFPAGETVPLHVLLGAEQTDQVNFFRGFREYITMKRPELMSKFGYDISKTKYTIDEILNALKSVGITDNIWMGDGITNCLPRGNSRLKRILARRDSGSGPDKVYAWTTDKSSTMREWLKLGVDAIIVNYPDRLEHLVKVEFKNSLVYATRATDPWKRITKSQAVPPIPSSSADQ